uniref:Glycosyltransferases n=1 Tax=Ananas comosus var. bracteatus TaxID=296719 RepID=A0A6V7PLQ7_ANACO|nr:unnamed protein product [Ananas comosus var. bracteatus]
MLAHSGSSNEYKKEEEDGLPVPIQGPACNASGRLVGWHTFNSSRYAGKIATFAGEEGMVLPARMEWAGFVLDSRLVWEAAEGRPDWVRDLDEVGLDREGAESPLDLLRTRPRSSLLGTAGRRWIINPPLDIVVPAKQTPWPDAPPELPPLRTTSHHDHAEKRSAKSSRSSRPRHSSRSKRKRDSLVDSRSSPLSQRHV